MASKQVRNAYKAADKGPKRAWEEPRRHERSEQERIRKEFEREKATAKAKVARDKKEKESAEKEAKLNQGLPLVNVRPNKETISWFLRGNRTSKKRDAQGKDVKDITGTDDGCKVGTNVATTNEDEPERPTNKAQKSDDINEDDKKISDAVMETIVGPQPLRPSPEWPIPQCLQREAETIIAESTKQTPAIVEQKMPVTKITNPGSSAGGNRG